MEKRLVKRIAFLFLIVLAVSLVCGLVYAAPPFEASTSTAAPEILNIVYPLHLHHEANKGFILNFDVLDNNFSKVNDTNAYCNFIDIGSNGSIDFSGNLTYLPAQRYWRFYVNPENNTEVGEHNFYVYCRDEVLNMNGFVGETYIITRSGEELEIPNAIAYSVFLFLMFTLMIVCLVWAFSIDGNNTVSMGDLVGINYKKYAKFFLYFMSYLFFILTLFFAWQLSFLFLLTTWTNGLFELMFNIAWISLFPVTVVWLVLMVVKFIVDLRIDKMVRRGLPPRSGA